MKKLITLCFSVLLMVAGQAQTIIHVPNDYPTIQQGINAANPGDTVLVNEGTYFEQVNFLGKKPLMVASLFLTDGDTSHISKTIIDGSQITNPDSASVVYLFSAEDTTSVLCGFTIRGGKGTTTDLWGSKLTCGAGIFITNSGASIRNNTIQDNELNDTLSTILTGTVGGGIYAYNGWPGWVIIENNRIISNRAISRYYVSEGGGLCVYNVNTKIIENYIYTNFCQCITLDGFSAGGGLLCMADAVVPFAAVSKNEISGNQSLAPGLSFGGGASTWSLDNNSYCSNNVFSNNKSDWFGGGLDFFSFNLTNFRVESNYFVDNEALFGGAVDSFDSTSRILLTNNVFLQNTAIDQGGAIYVNRNNGSPEEHMLVSVNNSFYDNHADGTGGAIYAFEDNPLVFNSILWQNSGVNDDAIMVESGTTEIAISDLDTNKIAGEKIIGTGMINADPMFINDSWLMTEHWSPCVDRGAVEYSCVHGMMYSGPVTDMLGNPRPQGSSYDMGAYDIVGWGLGTGRITNSEISVTNDPNPFNETTTFNYTLPDGSEVVIRIYDSNGKLVAEPVNSYQQKGKQKVNWNASNLPAGVYFFRIESGGMVGTGKVIKR